MTTPRTPYQDTSVSVESSKQKIRDLIKSAGARGINLDEVFGDDGAAEKCTLRFAWPIGEDFRVVQMVRLEVKPLAPESNTRSGWRISPEQRERQAWRGLYWYLKTMLEASQFGLLKFEDIFLSFFESANGRTIGEEVIPMLEQGRPALTAGEAS